MCSAKMARNSFLNYIIFDWSKLKTFAYNKLKKVQTAELFHDKVENIVRRGENAGERYFLLFQQQNSATLKDEGFWKHCGNWREYWQPAFSPFPMFSNL